MCVLPYSSERLCEKINVRLLNEANTTSRFGMWDYRALIKVRHQMEFCSEQLFNFSKIQFILKIA